MPRWAASKRPGLAATAPVKAPFSWPNSSDSSRSRGRPAQFRSTNDFAGAAALRVNPAREHALAGAGLAFNQDGKVALRGGVGVAGQGVDGRAAAGQHVERRGPAAGRVDAAAVLLVLDDAIEDDGQRRQLDRLREKVLGAFLDGRDGQLDRAMAGDDNHGHVDTGALELRHQIERRAVGQGIVHRHHVRHDGIDLGQRGGAALGFRDLVAVGIEIAAHAKTNPGFVVDN